MPPKVKVSPKPAQKPLDISNISAGSGPLSNNTTFDNTTLLSQAGESIASGNFGVQVTPPPHETPVEALSVSQHLSDINDRSRAGFSADSAAIAFDISIAAPPASTRRTSSPAGATGSPRQSPGPRVAAAASALSATLGRRHQESVRRAQSASPLANHSGFRPASTDRLAIPTEEAVETQPFYLHPTRLNQYRYLAALDLTAKQLLQQLSACERDIAKNQAKLASSTNDEEHQTTKRKLQTSLQNRVVLVSQLDAQWHTISDLEITFLASKLPPDSLKTPGLPDTQIQIPVAAKTTAPIIRTVGEDLLALIRSWRTPSTIERIEFHYIRDHVIPYLTDELKELEQLAGLDALEKRSKFAALLGMFNRIIANNPELRTRTDLVDFEAIPASAFWADVRVAEEPVASSDIHQFIERERTSLFPTTIEGEIKTQSTLDLIFLRRLEEFIARLSDRNLDTLRDPIAGKTMWLNNAVEGTVNSQHTQVKTAFDAYITQTLSRLALTLYSPVEYFHTKGLLSHARFLSPLIRLALAATFILAIVTNQFSEKPTEDIQLDKAIQTTAWSLYLGFALFVCNVSKVLHHLVSIPFQAVGLRSNALLPVKKTEGIDTPLCHRASRCEEIKAHAVMAMNHLVENTMFGVAAMVLTSIVLDLYSPLFFGPTFRLEQPIHCNNTSITEINIPSHLMNAANDLLYSVFSISAAFLAMTLERFIVGKETQVERWNPGIFSSKALPIAPERHAHEGEGTPLLRA